MYVNRGVLSRASNESELAGVLGHEIEHVVRRHSLKQMEQAQGANVGVGIACALTGVCNNGVAQAAIQVGGTAVFARFSRTDEVQADEGGFFNVMNAGINPRGMLTFFEKLLAEEQQPKPGRRELVTRLSDREIDSFFELARTDGIMPIVRKTAQFNHHRHLIRALLRHPPARKILFRSIIG